MHGPVLLLRLVSQLDEAADSIHQPHLLDRLAVGVEKARGADEHDAALGPRGSNVDAVTVEREADAAPVVLISMASSTAEDAPRFLPLELVHRPHAHAGGHPLAQAAHLGVVGSDDEDVVRPQ